MIVYFFFFLFKIFPNFPKFWMDLEECITKMMISQQMLLNLIENEDKNEQHHELLFHFLESQKIICNRIDIQPLLHLILKISQNHYQTTNFYCKLEQILSSLEESIKKFFSNSEIFNIFKSNKRILLFLFEKNILKLDQYIYNKITQGRFKENYYYQYFLPEINSFKKLNETDKDIEKFRENRKIGQNHHYLYELIRNDSIVDFIIYMNQANISTNAVISTSIFETNSFLLKNKNTTLIEYAAFYGSIQIFQYLQNNNAELTPSLWLYAIHSKNEELFFILEENKIEKSIDKCLIESIKCHHNDFVNYFVDNNEINLNDYFVYLLKYYNIEYVKPEFIQKSFLFEYIKYDYTVFYKDLIYDVDINKIKKISNQNQMIF